MDGVTGGAGGGGQQKSGRIKTTLKSLSLRAILLKAMGGIPWLKRGGCLKRGWKFFQTASKNVCTVMPDGVNHTYAG